MSMRPEETRVRDTKIGQPTVQTGEEPIKTAEGKGRNVMPGKLDIGKFGKVANLFSDKQATSKPVSEREKVVADKKMIEQSKKQNSAQQVQSKLLKSVPEQPKLAIAQQKPTDAKQGSVQGKKQQTADQVRLPRQTVKVQLTSAQVVPQAKAVQKQVGPVIVGPAMFDFLSGESASQITDLAKNYSYTNNDKYSKEMTLGQSFGNWISRIMIVFSGKSSLDGLTQLIASKLENEYNVEVNQKELKTWLEQKKNSSNPNDHQEALSVIAYALRINGEAAKDWLK